MTHSGTPDYLFTATGRKRVGPHTELSALGVAVGNELAVKALIAAQGLVAALLAQAHTRARISICCSVLAWSLTCWHASLAPQADQYALAACGRIAGAVVSGKLTNTGRCWPLVFSRGCGKEGGGVRPRGADFRPAEIPCTAPQEAEHSC